MVLGSHKGSLSLRLRLPVPNKIASLSEARHTERPQARPTDSFGEESVIVSEFLGLILCKLQPLKLWDVNMSRHFDC